MEAFKVPSELAKLTGTYPEASALLDAAKKGGEQSKIAIARLWMSEGIPYAFRDNPALYESVRGWLSIRLDVDPKDLHLSGSARIGQSLAPNKLGKTFGPHSDLDIFIISEKLFEKMKDEFNYWSYNFESRNIEPKNEREKNFWQENIHRGPKNLNKGFIDSGIIPNLDAHKTIKNISQTMWLLKEKLDVTEGAPSVKSASIRCYRDWGSYVRQMVLSFT
ncbi:MAG: hypothetical protein H6R15_2014 [Proteobacteria bacterium]|nr:hypothetical protein [Pseudomonadota bacterium]